MHYTTVFPLRTKGEVPYVLISWIRVVCLQLRERFRQDLPVLRLHSDRGGEFSFDLLREFCRGEGILQSFTLPASPQQNGIAERRIGLVMEVARTSRIHAAAPHFMWSFAVLYAAHLLNLLPHVSLSETSPTLRWMGKVGDASVFRVWGSRAFVHDSSTDKLSPRAIPCVFLGFPPDAPGLQFYHPTSRRVLPSQDVTFDKSVPFYRLFPYHTAPLPPPPPLFLAPSPPPVDPLPLQGPAPSGVSQVDPLPGTVPVKVVVDSGAARGAASGGAAYRGAAPGGAASGGARPASAEPGDAEPEVAEPRGAESEGVEFGGAEPGGLEPKGAESEGLEPGGADCAGAEPGGAEFEGAGSGGAEPNGTASVGGPAGARDFAAGGPGAGCAGATSLGGAGVSAGAGGTGGAGANGPRGARTGGTGAAGAGGARGDGARGAGAGGTRARGAGAGGTRARGAGAGDPRAGGAGVWGAGAGCTGAGGTVQRRPFFVQPPPSSLPPPDSVLRQVLGLPTSTAHPTSFLSPQPRQSQLVLQPDSPLSAPLASVTLSRQTLLESVVSLSLVLPRMFALFALVVVFLVRVLLLSPGRTLWHFVLPLCHCAFPCRLLLSPLFVPLLTLHLTLLVLPSPTVPHLLAIVVTDPSFESTVASALVTELVDFATVCRLDYATALVAESKSACPPSVGGECALGTDVLEER
ncbi:unnamed protein product [Closterium sp. NIES-53]